MGGKKGRRADISPCRTRTSEVRRHWVSHDRMSPSTHGGPCVIYVWDLWTANTKGLTMLCTGRWQQQEDQYRQTCKGLMLLEMASPLAYQKVSGAKESAPFNRTGRQQRQDHRPAQTRGVGGQQQDDSIWRRYSKVGGRQPTVSLGRWAAAEAPLWRERVAASARETHDTSVKRDRPGVWAEALALATRSLP